ncbi:MAG: Stf0 family sulfotransferase [Cyanobacteria bacterium P01_A01_bin.17]
MKKAGFCLLTTQRSGSTWLAELLDSHENVTMFGELFFWQSKEVEMKNRARRLNSGHNKKISIGKSMLTYKSFKGNRRRPWSIFQYIDQLKLSPELGDMVGFKLMYNQLLPRPEILLKLALDEYKIIHLVRQNYLDILISKASMTQNSVVHAKAEVAQKSVVLDTSSLVKDLSIREAATRAVRSTLRVLPNPVLEISYEKLQSSKDDLLVSVIEFLGLQSADVEFESDLRKISKGLYCEKIANYDQVCCVLEGTRFHALLKDC